MVLEQCATKQSFRTITISSFLSVMELEQSQIAHDIVACCVRTKAYLGMGHLEKVYQRVLIEYLLQSGFTVEQEITMPVTK